MRLVALGLIAALLAGCGSSASAGSRPPATTNAACHQAVQELLRATSLYTEAGKTDESLIVKAFHAGAYNGPVGGIVAKEKAARRMVSRATRLVDDAKPGLASC